MNGLVWNSEYSLRITEIRINVETNTVRITMLHDDLSSFELSMQQPRPKNALFEYDCWWEIKIYDKNIQENSCLEYGRYHIDFLDEDCIIDSLVCDAYEVAQTG